MESVKEPSTEYNRKKEAIKRYLQKRYDTDTEWRQKLIDEKKKTQAIKYATDPEYRAKILLKSKIKRDAKRAERMSVAIPCC